MGEGLDLEPALDTARRAVARAGEAALRRFHEGVAVELKEDLSPVTVADREAEAEILQVLREAYPSHDVLGEESGGAQGRASPWRWIIDPIDGTRGFSRGGSFWGPLLALEEQGEVVVGAMALPALGESYWAAKGLGAWCDGTRLRVSDIDDLAQATLSLGELKRLLGEPWRGGVSALMRRVASTRCYGDLASWAMLLRGRAELCLEAGVEVWDLAAAKILVEEAGGRFTNFSGGPSLDPGNGLASNGRLHETALAALAP
ncbi:MAG: inositol monophosphatase family protein [Planctomycetota bacterium]